MLIAGEASWRSGFSAASSCSHSESQRLPRSVTVTGLAHSSPAAGSFASRSVSSFVRPARAENIRLAEAALAHRLSVQVPAARGAEAVTTNLVGPAIPSEGETVARSVAARYAVAAFAFMAADIWLGVGLRNGFTCLFVFVLALLAVRLYQLRSGSRAGRADSRSSRSSPDEDVSDEERNVSLPATPVRNRTRQPGRVYDGDRDGLGWSIASEATW